MAEPFGAMPADRSLAAYGCGFGAVILGATAPRVLSLANDRAVPVSVFLTPWWLSALFAAIAVAIAVRVTGIDAAHHSRRVRVESSLFYPIRCERAFARAGDYHRAQRAIWVLAPRHRMATREPSGKTRSSTFVLMFAALAMWIGRGKASVIA